VENGTPKLGPTGAPEAIVCYCEKADIEIKGNWDTLGLRATGSYDYDIKSAELFVPDDMCSEFEGAPPLRGGNQYSIGIVGFTSWAHTSWALGVVRRALDEIAKLAPNKASVFGALGESASFKQSYAQAEAKFRSARAFGYEIWTDLSETLDRGEAASIEQITLIRMALRHIHDVGSEVTAFAYRAGGGVGLRPCVLQRTFRDMHSGAQHLLVADQIYQECARVLLGTRTDRYHDAGYLRNSASGRLTASAWMPRVRFGQHRLKPVNSFACARAARLRTSSTRAGVSQRPASLAARIGDRCS
jgi:hypothetical protein